MKKKNFTESKILSIIKQYEGDRANLEQVRILSDEWMFSYNNELPHRAFNDQTPSEYVRAVNSGKPCGFTTTNSRNSNNNKAENLN